MQSDDRALSVDTRHLPMIQVRLVGTVGEKHAEQLVAVFDELIDDSIKRDILCFLLTDARRVSRIEPQFRQLLGSWEAEQSSERYARCLSRVVVHRSSFTSMLVRGTITAMSWFSPRMNNTVMTHDARTAIAALDKGLTAIGGTSSEHREVITRWLDESY